MWPATKGQLISKAIYGLLTSPKKRTDKFVLFAFLFFMANKSNSSINFLGESTACQSAFWFYLTFRLASTDSALKGFEVLARNLIKFGLELDGAVVQRVT